MYIALSTAFGLQHLALDEEAMQNTWNRMKLKENRKSSAYNNNNNNTRAQPEEEVKKNPHTSAQKAIDTHTHTLTHTF